MNNPRADRECNNISNIVYPIIIFLSSWYIVPNIYRLNSEWNYSPQMIAYTIIWTLVPLAFIYLYLLGVPLIFKRGILSSFSLLILVIFSINAIYLFIFPPHGYYDIFMTGTWDHIFFPIVFGLFFVSDLSYIPKRIWLILLPFALFNLFPNLNIISNILFDKWIIYGQGSSGPPGFFNFWGVDNWEQFWEIDPFSCINCLTCYLKEQFTFFSYIPAVIIYNYIKKN